jgi:hypothetical protein
VAHNGQTVVSSAVALHVRRHAAAAVRHTHHQQRLSQEAAAIAAAAAAATAGATAGAVAATVPAVDAPPLKITLATTVLPSGNEVSIYSVVNCLFAVARAFQLELSVVL